MLEFEQLLKVFFSDNGSRDDLLRTLRDVRAGAHERTLRNIEVARSVLDRRTPFPQRDAVNQLVGTFLMDFDDTVDRWAEWAIGIVETWPEDPASAEPDLAAVEATMRRAMERTARWRPQARVTASVSRWPPSGGGRRSTSRARRRPGSGPGRRSGRANAAVGRWVHAEPGEGGEGGGEAGPGRRRQPRMAQPVRRRLAPAVDDRPARALGGVERLGVVEEGGRHRQGHLPPRAGEGVDHPQLEPALRGRTGGNSVVRW